MSRRLKIGVFIGVPVLLLGSFVWWLLPSGVTTANVGRLSQGMSVDEVAELFRKPPDCREPQPNGEVLYIWVDGGLNVRVMFMHGRLVAAEMEQANFPSFRAQIRTRFGWY